MEQTDVKQEFNEEEYQEFVQRFNLRRLKQDKRRDQKLDLHRNVEEKREKAKSEANDKLDLFDKAPLVEATNELDELLQTAIDTDDDIHRKRWIGWTTDKKYTKEVEQPVKELLTQVQAELKNPTEDPTTIILALDQLINDLNKPKAHYADKKGIKPGSEEDKQRDNKVQAIEERQKTLMEFVNKLQELRQQRQEMVETFSHALAALEDQQGTEEAMETATSIGKFLEKADPATRQAIFRSIPNPDALIPGLESVPSSGRDAVVKDLLKAKLHDTPYMDTLSEKILIHEIKFATSEGTLLRSNSMATKISAQYNMKCSEGQKYLATSISTVFKKIKKNKNNFDIDPNVVTDKKQLAKNIQYHKELFTQLMNDVMETEVPPEISKICTTIYDELHDQNCPVPLSEDKILTMVGGHLLLRLINPALTTGTATPPHPAVPTQTQINQSAVGITQSKILQSIGNGVLPNDDKMAPFLDLIKDLIPQVQKKLFMVVEQGRLEKEKSKQ
jgi:hypothetical protein